MGIETTKSGNPANAMQKDRRVFLEKAGKLAIYTSPVMLGLLFPGQHAIASGGGGIEPPPGC